MALTKLVKINENSFWAIWKIEEPFSRLLNSLSISSSTLKEMEVTVHHPKKKLEWLAGRLALQSLLEQFGKTDWNIIKDSHGKPHLEDQSLYISLANSFPFGTAIVHTKRPVGIDIEAPSEKILRVSYKFLNPIELKETGADIDLLCLYWCAKECIYKIHGRKSLSFREHIFIQNYNLSAGTISALVPGPEKPSLHQLAFEQVDKFFIVYNL